jgi:hypothetical protein
MTNFVQYNLHACMRQAAIHAAGQTAWHTPPYALLRLTNT